MYCGGCWYCRNCKQGKEKRAGGWEKLEPGAGKGWKLQKLATILVSLFTTQNRVRQEGHSVPFELILFVAHALAWGE